MNFYQLWCITNSSDLK